MTEPLQIVGAEDAPICADGVCEIPRDENASDDE
jgi:hypothetical protein